MPSRLTPTRDGHVGASARGRPRGSSSSRCGPVGLGVGNGHPLAVAPRHAGQRLVDARDHLAAADRDLQRLALRRGSRTPSRRRGCREWNRAGLPALLLGSSRTPPGFGGRSRPALTQRGGQEQALPCAAANMHSGARHVTDRGARGPCSTSALLHPDVDRGSSKSPRAAPRARATLFWRGGAPSGSRPHRGGQHRCFGATGVGPAPPPPRPLGALRPSAPHRSAAPLAQEFSAELRPSYAPGRHPQAFRHGSRRRRRDHVGAAGRRIECLLFLIVVEVSWSTFFDTAANFRARSRHDTAPTEAAGPHFRSSAAPSTPWPACASFCYSGEEAWPTSSTTST